MSAQGAGVPIDLKLVDPSGMLGTGLWGQPPTPSSYSFCDDAHRQHQGSVG